MIRAFLGPKFELLSFVFPMKNNYIIEGASLGGGGGA